MARVNHIETPNLEAHTPELGSSNQLSRRLENCDMPFADVSKHYQTKMARDEFMSTPTVGRRPQVKSITSGASIDM